MKKLLFSLALIVAFGAMHSQNKTFSAPQFVGDWNDENNWTPAGVPLITESVLIPIGTTCNITVNGMVANSVEIEAGSALFMISGTLEVQTDITVSGDLDIQAAASATYGGDISVAGTGVVIVEGSLEPIPPPEPQAMLQTESKEYIDIDANR